MAVRSTLAPLVYAALITKATAALPNVRVSDGLAVTADPGDLLMVGVDNPDPELTSRAITSSNDFALAAGRSITETVSIGCFVESWDGDSRNLAGPRARAFAILDAVAALLDADYSLGINSGTGANGQVLAARVTDVTLDQAVTDRGADVLIGFNVTYRARLR